MDAGDLISAALTTHIRARTMTQLSVATHPHPMPCPWAMAALPERMASHALHRAPTPPRRPLLRHRHSADPSGPPASPSPSGLKHRPPSVAVGWGPRVLTRHAGAGTPGQSFESWPGGALRTATRP
ncbi:hypothetical protein SEVIR_7G221050v4 [Setaria viridis]